MSQFLLVTFAQTDIEFCYCHRTR